MNKKALLITWTSGNYGTVLQAYAMSQILKLQGFKTEIISSFPLEYSVRSYFRYWFIKSGLAEKVNGLKGFPIPLRHQRMNDFKKRYLKIVTLYSRCQIKNIVKRNDVFITGSDQIWNTYHHWNPNFFLSFVKGKKKIAYSSSIGTEHINPKYCENVKSFLSEFSHIAVRELSAVREISQLTGKSDVQQVLDPVFLLSADEWAKFAPSNEIKVRREDEYLLCYLIASNEQYKQQLYEISKHYGCENKIVVIPSFENPDFFNDKDNVIIMKDAGPEDFVWLFRNAKCVCTDSFHATALAIKFNKQFVELKRFDDNDPKSQNSRLYDLLSSLHIDNKMYNRFDESWKTDIDYNAVNKLLEKEIERSIEYLHNALNN